MATKPKVVIALPTQGTVTARCALSLFHAARTAEANVDMVMQLGCDIVGSRIALVKRAKDLGATHVLFVDDDMSFFSSKKNSAVDQLLSHKKEIVGVPYNWRKFPLQSTAIPSTVEVKEQSDLVVDPETLPKELFECRTVGTGLLLIETAVFDKLPEPWFDFIRKPSGDLEIGEDSFFCLLAQKHGVKVWADPEIKAQHVGEYLY